MSFLRNTSGTIADLGENAIAALSQAADPMTDPEARQARARLRAFLRDAVVPDEAERIIDGLRLPVGNLDADGRQWSWDESPDTTLPLSGNAVLVLGADAKAQITVKPGPVYEFVGRLGLSGSLRVPFAYGALSAHAAARGKAVLALAFQHPADEPLGRAMAADLPTIARLGDPHALLTAAFRSVSLSLAGEINLGARLELGQSWLGAVGPGHKAQVSLQAAVGASYSADWAHVGEFEMNVRKDGALLIIEVRQLHCDSSRRAITIGANLRLQGVKQALAPVMQKFGELPTPIEGWLDSYGAPGELVGDRLRTALDKRVAVLNELGKTLLGEQAASQIIDDLAGEAEALLNEETDQWQALLADRVNDVVAKLLSRLPLPVSFDTDELTDQLVESLQEVSTDISSALLADLTAAINAGHGSQVATFLDSVSKEYQGSIATLNVQAAQLLAPLKDFLGHYREFEKSLINAVEATEKEELAVQYMRTVEDETSATTLLEFRLTPDGSDAVREVYRRMLRGDFADAMRMGMDPANHAFIELTGGQFKAVFERKRVCALNINVFGLGLSYQRILMARIRVQTQVGGMIDVLDAAASVSGTTTAFGETSTTAISSSLNLVAAQASPKDIALTVRVSYEDENMEPVELARFIQGAVQARLLEPGVDQRLVNGEGVFRIPNANGNRQLAVYLQHALTRAQLEAMTALDRDHVITTAIRQQLEVLDELQVYRDWVTRILPGNKRIDARNHALFIGSESFRVRALERLGVDFYRNIRTTGYALETLHRIGRNAERFARFLQLWAQLLALPLPTVDPHTRQVSKAEMNRLRELDLDLIDKLSGWAQVSSPIQNSLDHEFVSPWPLAFIRTLLVLTGGEDARLTLYVRWKVAGRVRRIAVR